MSMLSLGMAALTGNKNFTLKNNDAYTPLKRLADRSALTYSPLNISEMQTKMQFGAAGYRQLLNLASNNQQALAESTLLISLDGFYWPAAGPTAAPTDCEENSNLDHAIKGVTDIVELAKRHNKLLILGTVPEENADLVNPLIQGEDKWFSPEFSCVEKINNKMRETCTLEQNCLLVDLHDFINQFNSTGIVYYDEINSKASQLYKAYNYKNITNNGNDPSSEKNLRFDGIHLSELGLDVVATLIEMSIQDAFVANHLPGSCSPQN